MSSIHQSTLMIVQSQKNWFNDDMTSPKNQLYKIDKIKYVFFFSNLQMIHIKVKGTKRNGVYFTSVIFFMFSETKTIKSLKTLIVLIFLQKHFSRIQKHEFPRKWVVLRKFYRRQFSEQVLRFPENENDPMRALANPPFLPVWATQASLLE